MSEKDKINIEELREKAKDSAKNYYRLGLNCSECVFKSFLDLELTDYPKEVVGLSSGFGAGIGKTKNVCGAFLGAALSVASIKGRKNPLAKGTLKERVKELNDEGGVYSIFNSLVKEFEKDYGTIVCRELTEAYEDWNSRERKKNCQEIIGYAASLAIKHALKENEVGG